VGKKEKDKETNEGGLLFLWTCGHSDRKRRGENFVCPLLRKAGVGRGKMKISGEVKRGGHRLDLLNTCTAGEVEKKRGGATK